MMGWRITAKPPNPPYEDPSANAAPRGGGKPGSGLGQLQKRLQLLRHVFATCQRHGQRFIAPGDMDYLHESELGKKRPGVSGHLARDIDISAVDQDVRDDLP